MRAWRVGTSGSSPRPRPRSRPGSGRATSVPTIQALSDCAEERRSEELDRLFRRMPLADHERELVEQMSHRLVAGLLHAPLATLREDSSGELDRAARTLFSL